MKNISNRRPRRPTIKDVAQEAGVGVATVDRVLNGRLPVREQTASRVFEAAKALGYHATGLIAKRVEASLPRYRLGILLQKHDRSFYQIVGETFSQVCRSFYGANVNCEIDFVTESTPAAIGEKLKTLAFRNQAIAMVAPDHPGMTSEVEALQQRGIPVFSLLSDFAPGLRAGYVGLNNSQVGRTAAWMIARAARGPGKVACFIGSHRFHGHELREIGLRSYFREEAPDFEVLETMVNLDTPEVTQEATINLVRRHKDLVGIYVSGGGMEGALAALREENMAGKLGLVINEQTLPGRQALADNIATAMIAVPVQQFAQETVRLMVEAIDHGPTGVPSQTFLPIGLFIAESI